MNPHRNKAASGTNAAAVANVSAVGWTLSFGVYWSYSAAPTGGGLTITNDGDTFDVDITAAGPGFLPFYAPLGKSSAMVVTLKAGGPGVVGKINVVYGGQ
jgi:hypothetical protein